MATLLSLPVELQLSIVSHLAPLPHSIRPLGSALALSQTCHHFHLVLAPLVNSHLRLTTARHAQQVFAAPRSMHDQVSILECDRSSPGDRRGWSLALVVDVLDIVGGSRSKVTELRLRGVHADADADSLNRFARALESFRDCLVSLEIDAAATAAAAATVAAAIAAAPARDDTDGHEEGFEFGPNSFSTSARLSLSSALIDELRHLRDLRLRCVVLTDPPTLPWSSASATGDGRRDLRLLELHDCTVTDRQLVRFAGMSQGSLRHLVMNDRHRLSRTGLDHAIRIVGPSLATLEISLDSPPPYPVQPPISSPGYSSPLRLSPLRARLPVIEFRLDDLLPHLGHLRTLSLTGPLVSRRGLHSLPHLCPHLRSLSVTSNSLVVPSHLVPLLYTSQPIPLASLETLSYSQPRIPTSPPTPPVSSIVTRRSQERPQLQPTCRSVPRFTANLRSPPRRRQLSERVDLAALRQAPPVAVRSAAVDDDDDEKDDHESESGNNEAAARRASHRRSRDGNVDDNDDDDDVLLELTSLAVSRNVSLVGPEFEPLRDRIEWAVRETTLLAATTTYAAPAMTTLTRSRSRSNAAAATEGREGDRNAAASAQAETKATRPRKRPGICAT